MKNGLIAYTALDKAGRQSVFVIHEDGTGKAQLTKDAHFGLPSWDPTGKHIVCIRAPAYLCIMRADGSGLHPIANGTTPEWSPDGRFIAFSSARTGSDELWIMNADGSDQHILTTAQSGVHKVRPTWSPDGKQLAYVHFVDPNRVSIWAMNIDGTNNRQLTTGLWNNVDAFGAVINTANDANAASWGRGNNIAFWSGVEGNSGQIWTINPDSTGRVQLTHEPLPSRNDDPAWSPDSKKILFSTARTTSTPGQSEMWVMNADGTGQRPIAINSGGHFPGTGSWQPVP
jgi:TolB protein